MLDCSTFGQTAAQAERQRVVGTLAAEVDPGEALQLGVDPGSIASSAARSPRSQRSTRRVSSSATDGLSVDSAIEQGANLAASRFADTLQRDG